MILLDLMMVDMDGASFRWQQLADSALASIPIIVISALSDGEMTARSLGAIAFHQKPLPLDKLRQSVQRFR